MLTSNNPFVQKNRASTGLPAIAVASWRSVQIAARLAAIDWKCDQIAKEMRSVNEQSKKYDDLFSRRVSLAEIRTVIRDNERDALWAAALLTK